MSQPPQTPDEILHPKRPLWACNAEEDPRLPTGRIWHAIAEDRGTKDEWHQFRTRCGRMIGGVMSSIHTRFDDAPPGEPTCDECLRMPARPPSGLGDRQAG